MVMELYLNLIMTNFFRIEKTTFSQVPKDMLRQR